MNAMCWLSAAVPPAPPSPPCWPRKDYRRDAAGKSPPSPLPYRRIAAAGQPAAARRTGRRGRSARDRHGEMGAPNSCRPGTIASRSSEFADAMDKSHALCLPGRARRTSTRSCSATPGAAGAEVIEGCKVTDGAISTRTAARWSPPARDDGRDATWRARFVVDASGRDTFLASKFGSSSAIDAHNSSALYRPLPRRPAQCRARPKATSRSSGSTTAGSGSSR